MKKKKTKPIRNSITGELMFQDKPDFKPNLTPKQIFEMGSFGGTYWRPIYSYINKHSYKNLHKQYEFLNSIDDSKLTKTNYDTSINTYKVKVGTPLEFWESKGWISTFHPYGWMHWYCDFYDGKRCDDDDRQIDRWIKTAGPKSRWRRRLINIILDAKTTYNDYSISPKIRQVLQHWGYKLKEKDLYHNNYEVNHLYKMRVSDLKTILRNQHKKISGNKKDLIERILS